MHRKMLEMRIRWHLLLAVAAAQAVERIGMPESQIILSQAVTYVASAPKSNSAVNAIFAANDAVRNNKTTVPTHLQDAHYKGAQKLGHGIGYKYAHDYPNHYVDQQYLPDEIKTPGSMNPATLVMRNDQGAFTEAARAVKRKSPDSFDSSYLQWLLLPQSELAQ